MDDESDANMAQGDDTRHVRHFLFLTNGSIVLRVVQPFFTVRGSPATMK